MRRLLLLFFMGINLCVYSQSIGPYHIGSQGMVLENSELKLYSSIGEAINSFEESEDIMVSQGVLQSALFTTTSSFSSCFAKSGLMFFENCDDGTLFFFIKGDDGIIYDPYYADGISFDNRDSIQVNFGFELVDFGTPCSISDQAILINCISEDVVSSSTDIFNQESILVYPNPTSEFINVELDGQWGGTLHVQLFDLLGQKAIKDQHFQQRQSSAISLNLISLANGIYTLVISNDEALFTKNIVLSK